VKIPHQVVKKCRGNLGVSIAFSHKKWVVKPTTSSEQSIQLWRSMRKMRVPDMEIQRRRREEVNDRPLNKSGDVVAVVRASQLTSVPRWRVLITCKSGDGH